MEESLNILIVGHDLQAKCNVANAFIKQKTGFKQFQNLTTKKIVGTRETGLEGVKLTIILTPNINTPGWARITDAVSRYSQKVFLYVKSPGHVNVNDDNSIKEVGKKFGASVIQSMTYFENIKDIDTADPESICIHANMPLNERISKVYNVLSTIITKLKGKANTLLRGNSYTDLYRRPSNEDDANRGINKFTLERNYTDEIDLQDHIEDNQWELFNKTLKHGRAKSNHVRVNIIGHQGSGKTTLVSRLHGIDVKCPDTNQKPTEALEIKELTSRCTEVDGKKIWETNIDGYKEDLNLQRMAQAMKYANRVERNVDKRKADITGKAYASDEDDDTASVCIDSNNEEEIEDAKLEPYSAMKNDLSRVGYLKQILRKKNHSRGERMYISYWDFAGQSTYYSMHQVFMSQSAVYVLVVDLSVDFNKQLSDSLKFRRSGVIRDCSLTESLMFWISSIKAFTSDENGANAPVLIVGTHIDKVKENAARDRINTEKVINAKFDSIREILKMSEIQCIAINNANPDMSDLEALKNTILELGLGVIDEEIPAQWIDLEQKIQEHKKEKNWIMTFNDLKHVDKTMNVPIDDNTRLEAFLVHQHNRGHLIHFLHYNLKDIIVLEPDILAKFLNNLMRTRDSRDQREMKRQTSMYNHNGVINRNYIVETAKLLTEDICEEDTVDKLLNMLVHLSVIIPYKYENNDTRYLLPCLFRDKSEDNTRRASIETKHFRVVFQNYHMPPSFYHILVGGLLNEWKPIEQEADEPELYNLYACFRLDKETHQMEIFWDKSSVYIDIVNYSEIDVLNTVQMIDILGTIEKKIVDVFIVYRHTNTNFETRVLCPKHKNSFVSLSELRKNNEAMCYHGKERHAVKFENVFRKKLITEKSPECYKRKPTDKDLGRLARHLIRETATNLAIRLRIHQAHVIADRAAQSNSDENNRRLSILFCWRYSNGSETIGNLVDRLVITGDYHKGDFENLFEIFPNKVNYGKEIPDEKLDIIPDSKCDILAASDSVGTLYPFLMLELGIDYKDIELTRANNSNDLREIISKLLHQWRQQHPRKSTPRTLLDTAKFVGIDTTEIQKRIMRS